MSNFIVEEEASHLSSPSPREWETPLPLLDGAAEAFPVDALPHWVGNFACELCRFTQTPCDLPGVMLLSAISAACSGYGRVLVADGYEEPLNLYLVVALGPANRKSAVVSSVSRPFFEFEAEMSERLRPEVQAAQLRRDLKERQLENAKKKVADIEEMEARETASLEVERLGDELAKAHIPYVPRYLVDDCTPEKLTHLLAEHGGRLAFLSPEGGVFDMMAGRYSRIPNLDVYLKGHAGDPIRVDRNRAGTSPVFVESPAITFGLAVQPEVVFGLAQQPGFGGRGLLARFLYSLPSSTIGRRDVDPAPVSVDAKASYASSMRLLLECDWKVRCEGGRGPAPLQLSLAARACLIDFRAEIEKRLGANGDLAWLQEWAGKLPGAVVRIAGLLHLAATLGKSCSPIQIDTLQGAIRLGNYFLSHAALAFQQMGFSQAAADADALLAVIVGTGESRLSKQQVWQAIKGRFGRVARLDAALQVLTDHHFIVCEAKVSRAAGRRPAADILVNPVVSSCNSYKPYRASGSVDGPDFRDSRKFRRFGPAESLTGGGCDGSAEN